MTRGWAPPAPADTRKFEPRAVFEAGLRNHHVANTAYPLAHTVTWAPYRVGAARADRAASRAWSGIDDLCLYVHIPFCETRCSFCEYAVVEREELREATGYVDGLLREFDLYREALGPLPRRLHGFDVGGGTPSVLPAKDIARIVEKARSMFRFAPGSDISIETTPKIAAACPEKLAEYKHMGIDRISMGLQVVEVDLLKSLNRSANAADCHRRAVENVRAAGFERFNLDLMYGFAGQDLEGWGRTLQHAIDLDPEYITLYRMRYKLTRIAHQARHVGLDTVRAMTSLAADMLSDAGYAATPGKTTYSRIAGDPGTSAYLTRRVVDAMPYLGLGLGAQSFTHTTISYNNGAAGKTLAAYHRSLARGALPLQDVYDLPARQMMGKMCAVSFYFGEIDTAAFRSTFGVALEDVFGDEIDFVIGRGLMERTARTLRLTRAGSCSVNGVIALFYAPSIQQYLLEREPDRAERPRSSSQRRSEMSAHV